MMGLFGQTKVDPKEQVRSLQRKLRHENQQIQRQIHSIQREEEKVRIFCAFYIKIFFQVKREIKTAAKKGNRDVCIVLAKSMIQSRKVNKNS